MPQFRVLAKSFINNRIVEEGEVVEFDGEPGSNLEAIKPAKGKKAEAPAADDATGNDEGLV
jgi:hypothetical protein